MLTLGVHAHACLLNTRANVDDIQTAHVNIATRVCMHGAHARSHALRRSQMPPHTQAAAGVTFPSRSPGALRAWRCPGASDVAGEPAERGDCPGLGKELAPLRETRRPPRPRRRLRCAGNRTRDVSGKGGQRAAPGRSPSPARPGPAHARASHSPTRGPHARSFCPARSLLLRPPRPAGLCPRSPGTRDAGGAGGSGRRLERRLPCSGSCHCAQNCCTSKTNKRTEGRSRVGRTHAQPRGGRPWPPARLSPGSRSSPPRCP